MRTWPSNENRIKALSWQPGFSLSRRPVRKRRAKRGTATPQFEFIVERPGRKQGLRRRSSSSSSYEDGIASSFAPVNQLSVRNEEDGARSLVDEAVFDCERFVSTPHWTLDDASLIGRDESAKLDATGKQLQISKAGHTSLGFQHVRWSNFGQTEPSLAAVAKLVNASVPPGLLYSSLFQRFSPVLRKCIPSLCSYAFVKIQSQLTTFQTIRSFASFR